MVKLASKSAITAATLSMTSNKKAALGPHTNVNVSGNFHMDAPHCNFTPTSEVNAGSTSGNCFTQ